MFSRRSSDHFQETAEQFYRHMPVSGDSSLAILKAHLLVQERLWSILRNRLPKPSILEGKNKEIEFSKILLFVQALIPDDELELQNASWVWDAVTSLNTLRNKIGHKLDYTGISDSLMHIIALTPEKLSEGDDLQKFYYSCAQICSTLTAISEKVDWSSVDFEK